MSDFCCDLHEHSMRLVRDFVVNKRKVQIAAQRRRDAFYVDPTKTKMVRRAYEADMVRRFKRIRRAIIEAIVVDDVFGLQDSVTAAPAAPRIFARSPGKKAFAFDRSDQKIRGFMNWLRRAQDQDILEIQHGTPISATSRSWQNVYLESAYQRGLANAGAELQGQGVDVADSWYDQAFLRPTHADRAGLIYTRAYSQLDGITRAMDAAISRTLAQAIIEGRGARETAKMLADRVDSIGITRARTLARTETIAAHAEAQLNSYKEAGIEGVSVRAEYLTAKDDRVCPICEPWEGRDLTIEEAQGLIPQHPNCRCSWSPVVVDPTGKSLR